MSRFPILPRLAAALFLVLCAGALDAQQISATPTSVTLSAQSGSSTAVTATVNITVTGAVTWSIGVQPFVPWLSVTPPTGNASATLTLTASAASLSPSTYTTNLLIYNSATVLPAIPVTFTVGSVAANPASVQLNYTIGTPFPSPVNVTLNSGAAGSYTATASSATGGCAWLSVTSSGPLPSSLSIFVQPSLAAISIPGTYTCNVNVTPVGTASTVPLVIPVTLTAVAAPTMSVSATAVNLFYQSGGTNNQTQQAVAVTSSGSAISFGVSSTADLSTWPGNWVVYTPTSSTTPGQITISVDSNALTSLGQRNGVYTGTVTITDLGTQNRIVIPVKLTTSTGLPLLSLPATTLTFTAPYGGAAPAAQTVTPASTGGSGLQYIINAAVTTPAGGNWLVYSPASGQGVTPNPFTVSVNPGGLLPGSYQGVVNVTGIGAANPTQQIAVTLRVSSDPAIATNADLFMFAFENQPGLTPQPGQQSLRVTSTTGAPLVYTVNLPTPAPSWLVLAGDTTSATTPGVVSLGINSSGAAAGLNETTLTITATDPARSAAAPNSPYTVQVRLYVATTALLNVVVTPISFSAPVNGVVNPQSLPVFSTNPAEPLSFFATFTPTSGGNWLNVLQQAVQTPTSLTLTPSTNLVAGTYTGTLGIRATLNGVEVANSPASIPVSLTLTSGSLTVSPTSITNLVSTQNGPKATASVSVTGAGGVTSFTATSSASWLTVSPSSGPTPATLTVTADPAGLVPSTYQGSITVQAPGAANPAPIPVTFTVAGVSISAAPATLSFTQGAGAAAPPAQTISLTSTGGAVTYTATAAMSSGTGWLSVSPGSGTTPGSGSVPLTVNVNGATLAPGTYNGSVTITAAGAAGSPITVGVTLTVGQAQTLTVSQSSVSFSYQTGGAAPAAQSVQVTSTPGSVSFTATAQAAFGAGWLAVSPASGTTPATISISVNTANLQAGNYAGTVTVASTTAANAPQTINVTLTVSQIPVVITTVVNAASGTPGAVSPGEIVSLMGTNLGPASIVVGTVTGGLVDTKLGEVQVLFDSVAAPLLAVSATQINCIVPYQVAGRATTQIQVVFRGQNSVTISQSVVGAAPGIFTLNQSGSGPGAILNYPSYQANLPSNAVAKGGVIMAYATGEGSTFPAGVNGKLGSSDASQLPKPILNVTATIGGVPAQVLYAGGATSMVAGAIQINILVPDGAPSGPSVPIVITVGTATSQPGVTVAIQ
jgi:uncharacterized protein (TIGR03437 family)